MSSIPPSITQSQTFKVLRSFLLGILPAIEVFQAQQNRVPEPQGTDFVVMTPLLRERIETTITTYVDGYPSNPGTRTDLQPTKFTVQLDVHGPNAADNVQTISTLFWSSYAPDQFASLSVAAFPPNGLDISPLYTSDPRQSPFDNGEQQIEQRWSIDVVMQVNAATTMSQQFADELKIQGIISVEATYPPG